MPAPTPTSCTGACEAFTVRGCISEVQLLEGHRRWWKRLASVVTARSAGRQVLAAKVAAAVSVHHTARTS